MGNQIRYSPEVQDRAVRMVRKHESEYDSQWAAICSIAEKIGCTAETLRKWLRQVERDEGLRPGLTTGERERLKERPVNGLRHPPQDWARRIAVYAPVQRLYRTGSFSSFR